MDEPNTTRRQLLGTAGTAIAIGAAGCLGGSGGGGDTNGTEGTNGTDSTNDTGDANTTGGKTDQSQQGNTITFLNDRSARDTWEAAVEEFNANSDHTVEITWLPKGTSVNEQLAKMRSAGNLPTLIFETSSDCYSETLEGLTTPLTDVVEELGVKNTVPVDGDAYMVPAVASPLTMIYRSDIVEGDPRTREEWRSEAERIQEQEGQSAYAVPAGRTNAATTHMNQSLWNGGVDLYSGSGADIEVTFDQGENRERAVRTMEWLQQMDELGPQASGWTWGDCISGLIQGQLVGWAGLGGLAVQELQANRPELTEKFTPAPYPVASGQDPSQWWSYFEGIYAYKEGDNVAGGKEFIKYFMQSDYYFEYLRQTAPFSFPTSIEAIQDERYRSAEIYDVVPEFLDLVENNWDQMAPVLNTGDNGKPNALAANAYSQQLYGQAASELLYGDRSPDETIDWLAQQLRNL